MKSITFVFLLIFGMKIQAQQLPTYPQGDAAFAADVNEILRKSMASGDTPNIYSCTLSFDVRTDSTITNVNVIHGVSQQVDIQLKRVVSKLRYIPAIHNGAPMKMNIMKTINLTL